MQLGNGHNYVLFFKLLKFCKLCNAANCCTTISLEQFISQIKATFVICDLFTLLSVDLFNLAFYSGQLFLFCL